MKMRICCCMHFRAAHAWANEDGGNLPPVAGGQRPHDDEIVIVGLVVRNPATLQPKRGERVIEVVHVDPPEPTGILLLDSG